MKKLILLPFLVFGLFLFSQDIDKDKDTKGDTGAYTSVGLDTETRSLRTFRSFEK